MLFDIRTLKEVFLMPHRAAYNRWMERIDDDEHDLIIEAITEILDREQIIKSSWIPGKDWDGTVFKPICRACNSDPTSSALFFGLLVWEAALVHDKVWAFGRYECGGGEGLTYYQLDGQYR
ncbi:MAG: hypothetical protein PVG65_05795, partial [Candidatus Thorarchaeota archaeon]